MFRTALKNGLLLSGAIWLLAGPVHAQSSIDEENARLRTIEQQIELTRSRSAALNRERDALQEELKDVSNRLVALAGNIQTREARILESEEKLTVLALKESTLRSRLRSRRGALAELLAGLQRMERNPPPPLVVEPHDATSAVRGALLFGAIVPDLKGQAAALTRELAELSAVRERIKAARSDMDIHITKLAPARAELEALLGKKQDLLAKTTKNLEAEQARANELAAKAETIRDLLASLVEERRKAEIAKAEEEARKAAETVAAKAEAERIAAEIAAKQAEAARLAKTEAERKKLQEQEEQRLAALELKKQQEAADEARQLAEEAEKARKLKPREPVRFAQSIGKLAYPVQGEKVRDFNDKDGYGGRSEGLHIATRKQAQITVPVDGKVEFAGEFRSYGKLVILNTGDGYHLLLAGMENISVKADQDLVAGEPVGTMGTHTARGTLIGDRIDDPRPILYVELRKGSEAVDSSKWWLDQGQKAVLRRNNGGNEG